MRWTFVFILTSAIFAQQGAPPKPAAIEGKAVNSVTNEPLRKVDLTLTTTLEMEEMAAALAMFGADIPGIPSSPKKTERRTFKATTDANGKFRIEKIDPGEYYLIATHSGFVDQHFNPPAKNRSEQDMLKLGDGEELTGLLFRMVPQGAVAGRVVDEDGDPVPTAMVTAQSFSYSSGRRKLMPADTAQTNDRGEFRLGKLTPGHYYLSASVMKMNPMGAAPTPPTDGAPETAYVSTYYPRMTDISLASRMDVAAGADMPGLVIQLQKARVVRVRGQALGQDGNPLKGGMLMVMNPTNIGSIQMTTVGPEGRFELANLQPGSYIMTAVQMGGAKPSMTMQPLFVPNEGLDNFKFGSAPEKTVQGKVTVAGEAKIQLKDLTMMLMGDETAAVMPAMGKLDESGAFTVKVSAAEYTLTPSFLPPGTYLKSVMLDGRELLGKPLDFSSTGGELRVTLGIDGGQVDVSVSSGDKPLPDSTVVLLPSDPNRRSPQTTRQGMTDEKGHLSLKDVPPGDYLAFAWEKVEDGDWFDPVVFKKVENDAVHVTVKGRGIEKIELKALKQ